MNEYLRRLLHRVQRIFRYRWLEPFRVLRKIEMSELLDFVFHQALDQRSREVVWVVRHFVLVLLLVLLLLFLLLFLLPCFAQIEWGFWWPKSIRVYLYCWSYFFDPSLTPRCKKYPRLLVLVIFFWPKFDPSVLRKKVSPSMVVIFFDPSLTPLCSEKYLTCLIEKIFLAS